MNSVLGTWPGGSPGGKRCHDEVPASSPGSLTSKAQGDAPIVRRSSQRVELVEVGMVGECEFFFFGRTFDLVSGRSINYACAKP